MATPVGPAPRDPNDPDFWDGWDDEVGDIAAGPGYGWPVRLIALVVMIGIAALYILAR